MSLINYNKYNEKRRNKSIDHILSTITICRWTGLIRRNHNISNKIGDTHGSVNNLLHIHDGNDNHNRGIKMNILSEYALKVNLGYAGKYHATHHGQTITGRTLSEVVAKMCQLDTELKVRNYEMQQPKY